MLPVFWLFRKKCCIANPRQISLKKKREKIVRPLPPQAGYREARGIFEIPRGPRAPKNLTKIRRPARSLRVFFEKNFVQKFPRETFSRKIFSWFSGIFWTRKKALKLRHFSLNVPKKSPGFRNSEFCKFCAGVFFGQNWGYFSSNFEDSNLGTFQEMTPPFWGGKTVIFRDFPKFASCKKKLFFKKNIFVKTPGSTVFFFMKNCKKIDFFHKIFACFSRFFSVIFRTFFPPVISLNFRGSAPPKNTPEKSGKITLFFKIFFFKKFFLFFANFTGNSWLDGMWKIKFSRKKTFFSKIFFYFSKFLACFLQIFPKKIVAFIYWKREIPRRDHKFYRKKIRKNFKNWKKIFFTKKRHFFHKIFPV